MERDKNLCTCLVVKGNFDKFDSHAIECPYRLRYDEVRMMFSFNEQEIMGLAYFAGVAMAMSASEETAGVFKKLAADFQEGLKALAEIRAGKLNKETAIKEEV